MKVCPRCKRNCLEDQKVLNSLSHIDNKTYICSVCGQMEGYIGLSGKGVPTPNIPQYEFTMHEEFIAKVSNISKQPRDKAE